MINRLGPMSIPPGQDTLGIKRGSTGSKPFDAWETETGDGSTSAKNLPCDASVSGPLMAATEAVVKLVPERDSIPGVPSGQPDIGRLPAALLATVTPTQSLLRSMTVLASTNQLAPGPIDSENLRPASPNNTVEPRAPGFGPLDPHVVLLELHVRRPDGSVAIVSLPWQLAGNGELSQAQVSIAPAIQPGLDRASAHPLPESAEAGRGAALPEPEQEARAGTDAPVLVLPALSVVESPEYSEAASSSPTRSSTLATATTFWAKKLVRWVESQGAEPSLWVRDFSLDESAAQRLVAALRALSEQQGITLSHIVVNARELWRAPSPSTSQETNR
jgi:hypothetical protein